MVSARPCTITIITIVLWQMDKQGSEVQLAWMALAQGLLLSSRHRDLNVCMSDVLMLTAERKASRSPVNIWCISVHRQAGMEQNKPQQCVAFDASVFFYVPCWT